MHPKEFSWTSLNVMPFMNEKDLPQDKKIIILVDKEREKNLQNLSARGNLLRKSATEKFTSKNKKNPSL